VFKLKKKNLIQVTLLASALLVFASFIPALRTPVISIAKIPFNFLKLIQREIGGMIFYHHNMVDSQRLRNENSLLRFKLNELNEIKSENLRLEQLLSLKQKTSYKVIASKVVAHSPDNWSSVIIIDKGESSGIKKGQGVINYLGLVGRVVETSRSTAKVMLINDPNLGVSAINSRSRQEGLITGTLGGSLIMKYLPRESDINISDTIITSGFTESYPIGILIGTVVDVGEEFSGLSRYAIVKPAADLSSAEEVLVIIP